MDEIILHHTDPIPEDSVRAALASAPRVRLCVIDPQAYLAQAGQMLGIGRQLAELFGSVATPVMRADILRAAILYCEGGVYLDLDTITVAPLTPLIAGNTFVASELIVWPIHVRRSRSPLRWARSFTLDLLRKLCRKLPNGWSAFRHVAPLYYRSVTNAAMGAAPQARFFAQYLHAMVELPMNQRSERCALGPHLLQRLTDAHAAPDVTILDPYVFHPFPPEISYHWFRFRPRLTLDKLLPTGTLAVHWYASVRGLVPIGRLTPDYVVRNRDRQFYSALVCACASGVLPALGIAGNETQAGGGKVSC